MTSDPAENLYALGGICLVCGVLVVFGTILRHVWATYGTISTGVAMVVIGFVFAMIARVVEIRSSSPVEDVEREIENGGE